MEEENPFVTHQPKPDGCIPDLTPDEVEDDEQQEYYESSDGSESSSESLAEIEPAVREDMDKLEDTFHDMGLKFRMIDRIGEGMGDTSVSLDCQAAADLLQEPFRLFTKPKTCTTTIIRTTGTLSSTTERHGPRRQRSVRRL